MGSSRPDCAAEFDKASEVAAPGYYAVTLTDPAMRVEIAAAERAAIYRLTAKRDCELRLLVEAKSMFGKSTSITQDVGEACVSGAYRSKGWADRMVGYAVEFDRTGIACQGSSAGARTVRCFDLQAGETLMVKVGLSAGEAGEGGAMGSSCPTTGRANTVAGDGCRGVGRGNLTAPEFMSNSARKNLHAEIPGWDFDAVKAAARAKWNEVLGAATIEGTEEQKKNWYTSLYHLCIQPNNIADAGAKPLYSTFLCWDTFRAAGPLYTILYPEKAADRIREIFDKFYLPKSDGFCGNDDCGQMSAWYLFSAMVFYPFNPCGGEYVIGAPQVSQGTLRVPCDKLESQVGVGERRGNIHSPTPTHSSNSFTIIAKSLSKENKYVKSVTLNGTPITDWKIRHADIMKGGELVFEIAAEP